MENQCTKIRSSLTLWESRRVKSGGNRFRAKDDLHLVVPQRFFTHGQRSQGDRHVYASRTRFIPEKLLGLFERANWPVVASGDAARSASQGPRIDIGARMRGMWR